MDISLLSEQFYVFSLKISNSLMVKIKIFVIFVESKLS